MLPSYPMVLQCVVDLRAFHIDDSFRERTRASDEQVRGARQTVKHILSDARCSFSLGRGPRLLGISCRWLEQVGCLAALQEILGHAGITTTRRYSRLLDAHGWAEANGWTCNQAQEQAQIPVPGRWTQWARRDNLRRRINLRQGGEVPERLNGTVSKTVE